VIANDELARDAGLAATDGIVVDRNAMTSDPAIFAAGDCTRHYGREGVELRLECVQNAIDQAKHAALAMTGKPKDYSEVPWFWSDQYDLKLQIAGLAFDADRVLLRGDPATAKFAVFHLQGDIVRAVEAVNAPPEFMMGRKLIENRTPVIIDKLADATISMKEVAA
jgi:3-phenylpropionate/trans-cinnamate dioxygenase ferredoxin reductase subunit